MTSLKGKKENLAWKLGILEAHAGLEPNLQKCKKAAKSRSKPQNISKAMEEIRLARLSSKLYQVEKELARECKKFKSFTIRKLINKIKKSKGSSSETPDSSSFASLDSSDEKLSKLKSINHLKVAKYALYNIILKDFSSQLILLLFKPEKDSQDLNCQDDYDALDGKPLQIFMEKTKFNLQVFISKLLHHQLPSVPSSSSNSISESNLQGKNRKERREIERKIKESQENSDNENENHNHRLSKDSNINDSNQFVSSLDSPINPSINLTDSRKQRRIIQNQKDGNNHRHRHSSLENQEKNHQHDTKMRKSKYNKENSNNNQQINHSIDQEKKISFELHPSWKAAKQQNIIKKFKGKKIKFADE